MCLRVIRLCRMGMILDGESILVIFFILELIMIVHFNRNSLVNAAIVSSGTSFNGVNYKTTAQNITGLIAPGSDGVNHGACCFLCFIYLTDI